MKPAGWLRKRFPLLLKAFCLLLIVYILVYVTHSENGQYEVMMADINRIEGFGWVPSGVSFTGQLSEKQRNWDLAMLYVYYPLWRVDYSHFHPWKETYITDEQVRHWKDNHQLDDFTFLARKFPPKLSTAVITNLLGTPTRTNVFINGSKRWEYDFQTSNGTTYGSLFFDSIGKFQGCSTNASALAADLN